MRIETIPCLLDNYAYLVVCPRTGRATIVDPSEAAPVTAVLERQTGITLESILCTHHHVDHVGGNEELLQRFPGLAVHGSTYDRTEGRIPGQTVAHADGAEVRVGELRARALHVPGHTLGAVAYHFYDEDAVFTGDTLFLGGCGRLFEGTPPLMHASLQRLAGLPGQTRVYPGHEYTAKNLAFAERLEPGAAAVSRRRSDVEQRVKAGGFSSGATMAEELATNPFLRTAHAPLIEAARAADPACDGTPASVFAALRALKDRS
jgi:hydroxyacylglutathione hydrolase